MEPMQGSLRGGTRIGIVVLGAIVLAVVGALVLWRRSGAEGRGRGAEPRVEVAAPSGEGEAPSLAPATPAPGASPASARTEAEPEGDRAGADPGEEPGLDLLVVDAVTGEPAAGAALGVRGRDGFDPFDSKATRGVLATTDARGRARLAPSVAGRTVVALLGARSGFVEVDAAARPGDPPVRIELRADWDVEVEVHHADGRRAADIEVGLAVPPGPRTTGLRRRTGADGRVLFPRVGLRMSLAGEPAGEVRLTRALDAPVVVPIDAGEPPDEVLVLVLPACASVAVHVTDVDGAPVADGTDVSLAHLPPGTERDLSPFASEMRETLEAVTHDGLAAFDCVELGGELELTVSPAGVGVVLREFHPAPTRVGQRMELRVRTGLDHPVLVFRALDPDGVPLIGHELGMTVVERAGWMRNAHEQVAWVDSEGRVRLELVAKSEALGSPGEGPTRILTVSAREGELGARVDLSGTFEPGLHEMGDLRLSVAPLFLAGRVVDRAGAPFLGAQVQVYVPVRNGNGTLWYWEVYPRTLTSSGDGSFLHHAFFEDEELLVHAVRTGSGASKESPAGDARRCGAASALVATRTGARGVELVVDAVGSVRGQVLLDAGVPVEAVQVQLVPAGAEESTPARRTTALSPAGAFVFDALAPGPWDLTLSARGKELASLDGLDVPACGVCSDPRLAIDLRGRVGNVRLVLVTDPPQEQLHGELLYGAAGSEKESWSFHWFDGTTVDVLTTLASIDGTLTVDGYRTVHLTGVRGERVVRLEPCPVAHLKLPPGVRLPEPPLYLKATLAPPGASSALDWGGPSFDERRTISCRATATGRLQVYWILERRSAGGASVTTLDLPPQLVELGEGVEPTFELEVEDGALQEAIERSGV